MSDQQKDDKTEEPTVLRLKKAREEGNVAKSQEVSSAMLMLAALLSFMYSGAWMYEEITQLVKHVFLTVENPVSTAQETRTLLNTNLEAGLRLLAPSLTTFLAVAIAANVLQTGFVFSPKAMEAKPNRLDPIKGFKKVISTKGLMELVKGLLKIALIGVIIYSGLQNQIDIFIAMLWTPIPQSAGITGEILLTVMTKVITALVIISIIDALYSRFQHRKDLRMSKQEVKDEYKQTEGDPQLKGKRKQRALTLSRTKRLDHAVLSSDVVITNPTHYAVALQYETKQHDAPVVLAKGMRNKALKIRALAKHYEIPIIENPPVARALYASTAEGEQVPEAHFQIVAEILAFVYQKTNKQLAK